MFLGRGIRRPSKYLKAPSFKNQTDFGSLWMNCLRVNGPQQKYGVGETMKTVNRGGHSAILLPL